MRAELRKSGFWWSIVAVVAVASILNAFHDAGKKSADPSPYAPPPPPGATVTVADAVQDAAAPRTIAPLSLADPPLGMQFVFADSIDAGARAELRGDGALAARYFQSSGAGTLGPVTIYIATDPVELSRMYRDAVHTSGDGGDPSFWSDHNGCFHLGSVFLLATDAAGSGGDDEDEEESGSMLARVRLRTQAQPDITHELAHALDYYLAGSSWVDGVPNWLIEGSAEVETYTALDALGFRPYESRLKTRTADARRVPTTLAASNDTDISDVYTLGFLAVDRLTLGGDLAPLRKFWLETAKSGDWRASFERAFGTKPEAFEASFDAYRNANFPRYRSEIRGTVGGASDGTVKVWACDSNGDGCSSGQTDASGNFLLVVPDGSYSVMFEPRRHATTEKPTASSPDWYYLVGGATHDSSKAATIGVHDATVTGLDVPLTALQPSTP